MKTILEGRSGNDVEGLSPVVSEAVCIMLEGVQGLSYPTSTHPEGPRKLSRPVSTLVPSECHKGHHNYNSKTYKPLDPRTVPSLLGHISEAAYPGKAPRALSVMGMTASLAFMCTHSLHQVQHLGGWAPATSFVQRYLHHVVNPSQCVAKGTPLYRPAPTRRCHQVLTLNLD
ncbi:hypothetical protein Pcinc_027570 [Petrolisthes cinctipes]|uniref:Uncharacterized protein n=1 Tax=Petrolisthes cinctipes TaxID=88211 RepID=A0AAE1F4A0_PETCI|nr:hypothetical protein Pcinc_027570 [Petrolisthes cinctipes]